MHFTVIEVKAKGSQSKGEKEVKVRKLTKKNRIKEKLQLPEAKVH